MKERKNTDMTIKPDARKYPEGIRISILSFLMIILATAILLLFCNISLNTVHKFYADNTNNEAILRSQGDAADMLVNTDNQMILAQNFINSGNEEYLTKYVNTCKKIESELDVIARALRSEALINSPVKINAIQTDYYFKYETELYAVKLATAAYGTDDSLIPDEVKSITLSETDEELTPAQKLKAAGDMLYDTEYMDCMRTLRSTLTSYLKVMVQAEAKYREQTDGDLILLLNEQGYLNVALLFLIIVFNLLTFFLIIRPMHSAVTNILNSKKLQVKGSVEMRVFAESYNMMYDDNMIRQQRLTEKAMRDPLTGLNNRSVFDELCKVATDERRADRVMLMLDIDGFKKINDTYGHNIGDVALKKVSGLLSQTFSTIGFVCRVGGDEFAVIITDSEYLELGVIMKKLKTYFKTVASPTPGLPQLSVSVGIAFGAQEGEDYDLYKHADNALYEAKSKGPNTSTVCVYGEQ